MAIAETAYAKVNLYLHVTAIREDGYHELDSLFAFTQLGDHLTFGPADHLSMTATGPFGAAVPETDENLVLKAAQALQHATGCDQGADIVLEKNLPLASGIGGGSADAAAALRGLNRLWGLGLSDRPLEEIGAEIGADVPACVRSRLTYVSGIGERLDPAEEDHDVWLVLANPGVAVPTPAVFARFDKRATDLKPHMGPLPTDEGEAWVAGLADRQNDLQAPAIEIAPVIKDVVTALSGSENCLVARMSGSGATCFGLFAREDDAKSAADVLAVEHPSWWVAPTALRATAEATV